MEDKKFVKFSADNSKTHTFYKIAVIVLSVIVVLIIAGVVTAKIIDSSDNNTKGYTFSKIDGSSVLDMQNYNGNVILLMQTKTVYVEKSGTAHTGSVFTYSNPVMKVNNGNVLVYDRGGTGFRVERYSHQYYYDEAPGAIVTAAIGKKNTVAFSVDSEFDSFAQTCVYVKKSSGEARRIYKSSSDYCIALAVSDDDKHVAIAMLNVENAESAISIVICDLETGAVNTIDPFGGVVLTGFDYLSDGELAIYTDCGIYHVDKKLSLSLYYEYESTDFISCSVNSSGFSSVLKSDNGNRFTPTLEIFEKSGDFSYSFDFDDTVDLVSCSDKTFAVMSGSKITVYNKNGIKTADIKTTDHNRNICVTSTGLFILQSEGIFITGLNTNNDTLLITNNTINEEENITLTDADNLTDINESSASDA